MGQQMLNPYSATNNNTLISLTVSLNYLCFLRFLLHFLSFRKREKNAFHFLATSSKRLITKESPHTCAVHQPLTSFLSCCQILNLLYNCKGWEYYKHMKTERITWSMTDSHSLIIVWICNLTYRLGKIKKLLFELDYKVMVGTTQIFCNYLLITNIKSHKRIFSSFG